LLYLTINPCCSYGLTLSSISRMVLWHRKLVSEREENHEQRFRIISLDGEIKYTVTPQHRRETEPKLPLRYRNLHTRAVLWKHFLVLSIFKKQKFLPMSSSLAHLWKNKSLLEQTSQKAEQKGQGIVLKREPVVRMTQCAEMNYNYICGFSSTDLAISCL